MTSLSKEIFFDTDMYIHSIGVDPVIRSEAKNEFIFNRPSAMSEFSLVEFKGNYIACLILLRRKICDSDTFENAAARIINAGGRKSKLMLGQLLKWLGGVDFSIKPWENAKNVLITFIDSQIELSWESLKRCVDEIHNDIGCDRANC